MEIFYYLSLITIILVILIIFVSRTKKSSGTNSKRIFIAGDINSCKTSLLYYVNLINQCKLNIIKIQFKLANRNNDTLTTNSIDSNEVTLEIKVY